jgi:PAS domain S-box-containing protein
MVDADFHNVYSPNGLASLREAFEKALRRFSVNGNASCTIVFSPVLSTLLADLTTFLNGSSPAEGYRATGLSTGREFARTGSKVDLRLDQLHHLGCQLRDLSRQFLADRVGADQTESAAALKAYFDEFLLGVATESVHLETTAFHKKLREANRFILQERRRYYTIFKRMEEPAFIIDRGLHLLETNRAFDHFFKISGKDHIGRNCYEVLGDDFRAACVLQDFLHAQGRVPGIEVDLAIHGEPRSIIVNGTFLGDINHESAGGIVILQDITPRRAAERALRDSERQYRSLIENVPDVTWRLNQQGEFAFVSPNAEKIYGYTAAEMMESGANRCFRIHPDDIYLVRSEFTLFFASHLPPDRDWRRILSQLPSDLPLGELNGNKNFDVKYRFQKKDGSWVWLHDRASRIDTQGGEWYADGVTSDITALKMAEAELERHHFRLAELVDERTLELQTANQLLEQEIAVRRQTEQALMDLTARLSTSNQELDQFAHVASHDLKEPLMLIIAFSERLAKRYSANLDDKGMEYLRRITAAAEHMRQLIEGFLALSQVNSGAQTYEEIDLADLIQEVLQSLEERIKESHARIEIGKLGRLDGDRVQIRQLFQNIISNALKYRKPEGQPLVVLQGEMVDDTFYEILVQDNGIGFDPQDAERIFKPLERLHSRREFEGTGMGLTTCQKIVARHGGEILARGLPGEGATFVIRLPVSLAR